MNIAGVSRIRMRQCVGAGQLSKVGGEEAVLVCWSLVHVCVIGSACWMTLEPCMKLFDYIALSL